MSVRRRWRLVTAMLSLCALLFTQTAVAAYACQAPVKAVEKAQMAEAGMPCAESMSIDDEQPELCHAHCQSAQGALDQYQPINIAAPISFAAVLTSALVERPDSTGAFVQAPLLRTSASPPLAITNCCFRI